MKLTLAGLGAAVAGYLLSALFGAAALYNELADSEVTG